MMARMIYLSTLGIGERNPNAFNDPERAYGWNDLLKILEAAPTVDAVEVVRCKDCKHWHEGTGFCEKHSYFVDCDGVCCSPSDSPNWTMFDPDDFCSYGERKEGAD